MNDGCCNAQGERRERSGAYQSVLWGVLGINGAMFLIEVIAGLVAGSVSLQADALDFCADAANYGISLFVLGKATAFRARAAITKGATMGLFGLWVLITTLVHVVRATVPAAETMGLVGLAALIANAASFALLWAYRGGDSNMRSVWICSRNDVLGNLAVLLAAGGVFRFGAGWPDVSVAAVMGVLAIQGSFVVIRQALAELGART
jgi:Co/Zn/Cd efflux system component